MRSSAQEQRKPQRCLWKIMGKFKTTTRDRGKEQITRTLRKRKPFHGLTQTIQSHLKWPSRPAASLRAPAMPRPSREDSSRTPPNASNPLQEICRLARSSAYPRFPSPSPPSARPAQPMRAANTLPGQVILSLSSCCKAPWLQS